MFLRDRVRSVSAVRSWLLRHRMHVRCGVPQILRTDLEQRWGAAQCRRPRRSSVAPVECATPGATAWWCCLSGVRTRQEAEPEVLRRIDHVAADLAAAAEWIAGRS